MWYIIVGLAAAAAGVVGGYVARLAVGNLRADAQEKEAQQKLKEAKREAESILKGNPFTPETVKAAAQKASQEAQPRSSPLRGSAEYRKTTVGALTQRALLSSRAQIT